MNESTALVCIIDDDASVCRSLQRLLVANDFRVAAFADAQNYLEHGPDLCFSLKFLSAVDKLPH
jgi:FixJ family two-component response regulator